MALNDAILIQIIFHLLRVFSIIDLSAILVIQLLKKKTAAFHNNLNCKSNLLLY